MWVWAILTHASGRAMRRWKKITSWSCFVKIPRKNYQPPNLSLGPFSSSGAEGLDGLAGARLPVLSCSDPSQPLSLAAGDLGGALPLSEGAFSSCSPGAAHGVWSGEERIPTWNRVQVFPEAPSVWWLPDHSMPASRLSRGLGLRWARWTSQ